MTRRPTVLLIIALFAVVGVAAGVAAIRSGRFNCLLRRDMTGCTPEPLITGPLPDTTGVQARVDRIDSLTRRTDSLQASGQLDSLRKPLPGYGDSASVIIYTHRGEVAKIHEMQVRGDGFRTLVAYYDHDGLVYVYETGGRLPGVASPSDEERSYFSNGTMIRWLTGRERRNEPGNTAAYVDHGNMTAAFAAHLLEVAHEPEATMPADSQVGER